MKLTTLLLIVSLLKIQASTYSQDTKLTLNFENAPVEQVLNEIESTSEFRFLYESELLDPNTRVTIHVVNKKIANILNRMLKGLDIDYQLLNRQILLFKKKNPGNLDEAPPSDGIPKRPMVQRTISGAVTDDASMPLPGANVIEKGTTNGTQTDFDGNFTLEVTGENPILVVSYIGFETREVAVSDRTDIRIVLKESAAGLEEVVVVGYGAQTKSSLTGAVSTIKSEDLTQAPTANTTNLLAGRSTGVITRQTSSQPGSDAANISIRGFDTPLIMVDGVQSTLGNLDPNDIESITVLKDAAAAIYGVRAGEGVILVTTKRGKEGKTSISLHTNTTFQEPTRIQNRLGAVDYLEMGLATGGTDPDVTQELLDKYNNGEANTPDTDWYEAV
ncbi:MAG: carboxypeptidase-like regulatory domain-containing protein, partial [Flavobacteriaceae bacterium]